MLELSQKEGRNNYVILGESAAKDFCESLEDYINRLDLVILANILTDTPISEVSAISSAIIDEDKTAIFLFYNDVSIIESFISHETIQALKSRVKIVSFGVIDEFITTSSTKSTIYEDTYSVNGYFESFNILASINSDVYFISYLMLKYLDDILVEDGLPSLSILYLQSKVNNFSYTFNGDNMKILNSNVIGRTMYFGKVGSDGKISEIINLQSNIYESPYTLFTSTNITICSNLKLVEDEEIIKIGFISKKSFSDSYYHELYRGFILLMNEYQQNVFIFILFVY